MSDRVSDSVNDTASTAANALAGDAVSNIAGDASLEPQRVLVGNIQKFSVEDGPGIRTTIFLKGCPLSCKWCHNPELINPNQQLIQSPTNCIRCGCCIEACPNQAISPDEERGVAIDWEKCDGCLECVSVCYAQALRGVAKPMSVEEILSVAEQDKGFYDNTGGGITISGGELLLHTLFASELIDKAASKGISACLDTCGFGKREDLLALARKPSVTTILYDLKSIDPVIHKEFTGVDNKHILANLKTLAQEKECLAKVIVRMPLIKGVNDSQEQIERVGAYLCDLGIERIDLLPYHGLGIQKQRNIGGFQEEFEAPSDERIEEIRTYFEHTLQRQVGILGQV